MPALSASYNDGCITCTFLNKSASPCVVIASKKSQISDRYGLLNIEVFNLLRDRETNESCIFGNMSLSEFNIIAFAYDGIIKGVGVPIVDGKTRINITACMKIIIMTA